MRNNLVFILIIFVLLCTCKNNSKISHYGSEWSNNFQIRRGINISHWLSQNPDKSENRKQFFTKEDTEIIARLGYDHVRIPVDEEHLWDENGNRMESSFSMLQEGIGWCLDNDLKVIIDLHQIRSHTFNNQNNLLWTSKPAQADFIQMWLSLSNEFSKYTVKDVAYELLNEAVADSSSQWNNLLKITIDSLRKYEPERKIIIGSNRWQSPDTFDELIVPENDSNIILSFHFYAPHAFTHYRAPWMTSGIYTGDVKYPGQVVEKRDLIGYPDSIVKPLRESNGYYTKDTLQKIMKEPIRYAQDHHLQLYCGEFGAMPTVRRGDRLAWYTDVRTIFEENNIAWSNWDYKGALFGIHYPNGQVDEYLVKALIPDNKPREQK
ncbi:MAG: glycoside hydrolase family 5 protein [Prolixibacteraceae bacterium]